MIEKEFQIQTDQNGHCWLKLTDNQKLSYNRDKDLYLIEISNEDGTVVSSMIPAYLLDQIYNYYWDNLNTSF